MACTPLNRHSDRMTERCLGLKREGEGRRGRVWLAPKYFFLFFCLILDRVTRFFMTLISLIMYGIVLIIQPVRTVRICFNTYGNN